MVCKSDWVKRKALFHLVGRAPGAMSGRGVTCHLEITDEIQIGLFLAPPGAPRHAAYRPKLAVRALISASVWPEGVR
jgi:hypothetical protein